MQDTTEDVVTDELFVGLTRPALQWGIPYTAFVIEVMLVVVVFLAVGNPFSLMLLLPLHAVMYAISSQNPKAFDGILIWLTTIGRCRTGRFWRAASFSPRTLQKWQR